MKIKGNTNNTDVARLFYLDKTTYDLLKRSAKNLKTYQVEIVREALKEFFEKRNIT